MGASNAQQSLSPPPLRSPREGFPSRPMSPKSTASTSSPRGREHTARAEYRSKSPRGRPIMGTGKYQGAILGYHSPRGSPTFTSERLPTFKGKTESFTRPKSPRARLPTSPNSKAASMNKQLSPRRDLAEMNTSNHILPSLNRAGNDADITVEADDINSRGGETGSALQELSFGEIMAAMSKTKEDSLNRKRTLRHQKEARLREERAHKNIGKGAGHMKLFNANGSAGHLINKDGNESDVAWDLIRPDTDMTLLNSNKTSRNVVHAAEYRRASCIYNTHSDLNKAAGHRQPWHTPKSSDNLDAKLKGFGKPSADLMTESGMKLVKQNLTENMVQTQKELEKMQEEAAWGSTRRQQELLVTVMKHQEALNVDKKHVTESLKQKFKRNIKKVMAMRKAAKMQSIAKSNRRGDTLSGLGNKFSFFAIADAAQGKKIMDAAQQSSTTEVAT